MTSSPTPSPTDLSYRIVDIYEDKQTFLIIIIAFASFCLCLICICVGMFIELRKRRVSIENKRNTRIEKLHSDNNIERKKVILSKQKSQKDIEMGEIILDDKKKDPSSPKKSKK
jgi:hypothetical protein